jgi:hypothetical protein
MQVSRNGNCLRGPSAKSGCAACQLQRSAGSWSSGAVGLVPEFGRDPEASHGLDHEEMPQDFLPELADRIAREEEGNAGRTRYLDDREGSVALQCSITIRRCAGRGRDIIILSGAVTGKPRGSFRPETANSGSTSRQGPADGDERV